MFTEDEIAYLKSQPLARIATVSVDGQPDNSATGFEFDGEVFYLGSMGDLRQSRRGKSVLAGNTKVSLIVDDLESIDPWRPRSIRIYGTANSSNVMAGSVPNTTCVLPQRFHGAQGSGRPNSSTAVLCQTGQYMVKADSGFT